MGKCRVPAAIIAAVVIGGAGLAGCGTSTSSSSVAAPASSAIAGTSTPALSPTTGSPTSASAPASSASPASSIRSAIASSATANAKSSSSGSGSSSGTHSFTVPAIPGDDIVTGYGSYTKNGTASVKLTICAKQTANAFSVGTEAVAYNSSGASTNLGAVILTGPGDPTCVSQNILFYTAHLKVHAFIGGSQGSISKTGPVLTLY